MKDNTENGIVLVSEEMRRKQNLSETNCEVFLLSVTGLFDQLPMTSTRRSGRENVARSISAILFAWESKLINVLFLIAALALPGLPQTQFNDYNLLREFLESKYPEYEVFYIAEGEELLMKNAEWTPLMHEGLRIWTLPRRAA